MIRYSCDMPKSTRPPKAATKLITQYQRLLRANLSASQKNNMPPPLKKNHPCVVICAPHPDDECLMGAIALHLRRLHGWQIVNFAVTYGSDRRQVARRKKELRAACGVAGFSLFDLGLNNVNLITRKNKPREWRQKVDQVAAALQALRPKAIVLPHADDGHPTHIGTHWLVMDALRHMPRGFKCDLYFSEYWHPQKAPNLLHPCPPEDAALLLAALACHAGENKRNNFAARFPAWLMDNVRRGAEIVGGKGARAPQFDFGMVYKKSRH